MNIYEHNTRAFLNGGFSSCLGRVGQEAVPPEGEGPERGVLQQGVRKEPCPVVAHVVAVQDQRLEAGVAHQPGREVFDPVVSQAVVGQVQLSEAGDLLR